MNINKVLEHLRTIGKFNTRHLWSSNEIACAHPRVIWEFLDDIWHFYSNKNNLIKKDFLKRKNKKEDFSPSNMNINMKMDRNSTRYKHDRNQSRDKEFTANSTISNLNTNREQSQNFPENVKILHTTNTLHTENSDLDQNYSPNILNQRIKSENLQKVKSLHGGFDKYIDISNFQKTHKEPSLNIPLDLMTDKDKDKEISSILILPTQISQKNEKTNDSQSLNNLTAIANCLGMNTSKAKRKREGPKNSFFKEINKNAMKMPYSQRNDNKTNNLSYLDNSLSKSNMNKILPSSRRSVIKNSMSTNKTSQRDLGSNSKENSCFIIFQKSNAKKLKKEIENFPLNKNNLSLTENSIYVTDDLNFNSEIIDKKEKKEKINTNFMKLNLNKKFSIEKENENFFETFKNFNQENYSGPGNGKGQHTQNSQNNLNTYIQSSTEEESFKSHFLNKKLIPDEKDIFELREWMMTLGIKESCNIDFSKEEIEEFKDGIFLSNLISKLENKKIAGINQNPRGSSSMLKNITKSLEILRNKKVKFYFNQFILIFLDYAF